MSEASPTLAAGERWALSGLVFFLAAYLAAPSLLEAWGDDRYSVGAVAAFLIWFLMVCKLALPFRAGWGGTSLIWVVSAVFFCAVGSMSSLRVLYHAALVVAVLDLSKLGFRVSFLAAVCALSWLPSSGWLISRFHAGGLLGWERPVLAGLGWMFLILVKRRISFSPP
jgi:hypothetical protein